MYRRSAWEQIGGYNESLDYQEDYDFWIKFITKFDVHNVNLPLMYYRQHGSSMSTNFSARMNARRDVKRSFVETNSTFEDTEVLGIIPARAEDRIDLPSDVDGPLSLVEIDDRPLIDFTIAEVQNAQHVDRLLVSTEDEAIAEVARELGAEVPFLRDETLSSPTTQLADVIESLLERLRATEDYEPDVLAILPYVSPLRTAEHVDEAIDTSLIFSVDSVISVYENSDFLWQPGKYGLKPLFEERLLRRDRESMYHENGAIYVTTPETVLRRNELIGQHVGHILMEERNSLHIDSRFDFDICSHLLESPERIGYASSELQPE
jgi:N-acylneuraminate cytidylyltransferase/CMP-N,N'-diacetyllegionaminic acid synthase